MQPVWFQHYPPGVAQSIGDLDHETLAEVFSETIEKYATKTAFRDPFSSLTYQELDRYARAVAGFLQEQVQLKKGDRVALMMPNMLQYPVALFACLRAGFVVVNVNPQYTAGELEKQLKNADVAALIVLEQFINTVNQVESALNLRKILIVSVADFMPGPKALITKLYLKYIKRAIPGCKLNKATTFKSALKKHYGQQFHQPTLASKDIAILQYTGGTTGVAKGAILTHGNMVANLMQASIWFRRLLKQGEETVITPLPLYHIFALLANCLLFFELGGENILITDPRDMSGMMRQLKKIPFTVMTGVNTLFNAFTQSSRFRALDFSQFKLALGGGMAVHAAVAEKFQAITGVPILEAYGLTETSPGVAINPTNATSYSGFVGLPLPSTEVSVRDTQGVELGFNQLGELWVRGPQVMQGYWCMPEETAHALTADGWFKTGDIVEINEQGYIKIVDRQKDMILVSGFNVYPNEVEAIVAQLPGVLEVAVIGVPHPIAGEVVKVFVVKKDPALTKADITSHCKEFLTSYKIPKLVEFKDSLPKSNVGKILRRKLQEIEKAKTARSLRRKA